MDCIILRAQSSKQGSAWVPVGPLTWEAVLFGALREADLLGPKETSLTVRDNLPDPLDQHTGHRLCACSPLGDFAEPGMVETA